MRVTPPQPPKTDIIHSIPCGPITLDLKKSANAWWVDHSKVYRMLTAFEVDCTIEQACAYAGITERQYKYFATLHPDIREIRSMKSASITMRAKMTIIKNLDNHRVARWVLEHLEPETFGNICSLCRKEERLIEEGVIAPMGIYDRRTNRVYYPSKGEHPPPRDIPNQK